MSGKQAIAAATSSSDTDVNSVNDGPGGTGRYVGGDDAEVVDRIRSTFSVKNRVVNVLTSNSAFLIFAVLVA